MSYAVMMVVGGVVVSAVMVYAGYRLLGRRYGIVATVAVPWTAYLMISAAVAGLSGFPTDGWGTNELWGEWKASKFWVLAMACVLSVGANAFREQHAD